MGRELDLYKLKFCFQIDIAYFGLFCIDHYSSNVRGTVYLFDIETMLLKVQILNINIDIEFSDLFYTHLQSFTSTQSEQSVFFFRGHDGYDE